MTLDERWWMPFNCVLVRNADHADEGTEAIASHFPGKGRFERAGKGFRWAVE